jgi:hypothetical protein
MKSSLQNLSSKYYYLRTWSCGCQVTEPPYFARLRRVVAVMGTHTHFTRCGNQYCTLSGVVPIHWCWSLNSAFNFLLVQPRSGFGYSASKWTFSCVLDEAACDEPLFLISPSILRQRLLTFLTTGRRRKPSKTFDEAASIQTSIARILRSTYIDSYKNQPLFALCGDYPKTRAQET